MIFQGEHRNCDLVALCSTGARRIAINIEAKADEPFGDTIGMYYDRKVNSPSNAPARIRQLSLALFGRLPDEMIRKLRYQLLHAAAATLIEAAASRAEMGLFVVHEFRSKGLSDNKLHQNCRDWENFRPRISRTYYDSGGEEPDSRPSFRARWRTCAVLCAPLSRKVSYRASIRVRFSACTYQSE
jgi:hypothetical protein